ncbi:MAG: hypothetical protein ACTHMD_15965 [Flavisolibacter sp.]
MRSPTKTTVIILLILFSFSCNSNSDEIVFNIEHMPDSIAKRYLDSLAWVIDKSIPLKERGFPANQKNKSYFEERPYFDSSGRLKKVAVYEFRSDSFINYTDYYYRQGQFIKMRNDIAGSGKILGIAYYIFNGNKIIDSATALMQPIPGDTLLRRALNFRKKFEKHS